MSEKKTRNQLPELTIHSVKPGPSTPTRGPRRANAGKRSASNNSHATFNILPQSIVIGKILVHDLDGNINIPR